MITYLNVKAKRSLFGDGAAEIGLRWTCPELALPSRPGEMRRRREAPRQGGHWVVDEVIASHLAGKATHCCNFPTPLLSKIQLPRTDTIIPVYLALHKRLCSHMGSAMQECCRGSVLDMQSPGQRRDCAPPTRLWQTWCRITVKN